MSGSPDPSRFAAIVAILFGALGLGSMGCVETLPVPPSRIAVHDTPATVGAGNAEVAGGVGVAGSVFNGTGLSGGASVTRGLRDDLDLRGDVLVGGLVVDSGYLHDRITAFGLARLGLERSLVPGVVSVIGGVGGGATRAGGFVSADAGLLLGYENRYVSPFAGAVLHAGTPLSAPLVRIDYQEDPTTVRTVYRRAYPVFGWVASAGVRVPFGGHRDHVPHRYALQLSFDVGASYGNDPAIPTTARDFVMFGGTTLTFRTILGTPRDPR